MKWKKWSTSKRLKLAPRTDQDDESIELIEDDMNDLSLLRPFIRFVVRADADTRRTRPIAGSGEARFAEMMNDER